MKIKTKILGSISLFIILFAIGVLVATFYFHVFANKHIDNILKYGNELEMVNQLESALLKSIMPANDYLIHGDEEEIYTFDFIDAEVDELFEKLEGKYFPTIIMVESKELLYRLKDKYAIVKTLSEKIFSLSNPIGNAEGARLMEEMDLLIDYMYEDMQALHRNSRLSVLKEIEIIDADFYRYVILILSILTFIIVGSVLYGILLVRSIISPIMRLIKYMGFLAKGDLNQKLDVRTKDEIGDLTNSFNKMAEDLQKTTVSRNYFDNIINSMADALVVVTPEDRIQTVNQSTLTLLGYKKDDLLQQHIEIIFAKEEDESLFSNKGLFDLIKSGSLINAEMVCQTKDGRIVPVLCSSSVMYIDNKIKGIICIARDISERKKIEEELRISQKMVSIGKLAGSVFHEILNPVNIISAYVQLMLMEAEKDSSTEKDLKSVQEEISRIVQISDGLVKFSRQEERVLEEIEINELLDNTLSLIDPEMRLKSIKVIREYEKVLPNVTACCNELTQVFMSLITNSIDAMPEGGTLTISTRSIQKNGNSFVSVSFVDTGCGIAKKDIDKIFEPFFSTKKEIKGVGLGLSTSYALIDGYGGKISVKSEEGKGTTFTVDLPVKDL